MSKPFRTTLGWMIPTVFVLCYAFWPALGLPRPCYAPALRQITWDRPPDIVTQAWYGRLLMACAAAIVLGTIGTWALSRLPKQSWTRYGPWVAVAATVLAMIVTAVHEIRRWML